MEILWGFATHWWKQHIICSLIKIPVDNTITLLIYPSGEVHVGSIKDKSLHNLIEHLNIPYLLNKISVLCLFRSKIKDCDFMFFYPNGALPPSPTSFQINVEKTLWNCDRIPNSNCKRQLTDHNFITRKWFPAWNDDIQSACAIVRVR